MDTHSLSAAAVTNTTVTFLAFMPKPDEILDDIPDANLRVNEVSAAAVSIGLGIALSFIGKSGAPLAAAIVASICMVAGYEYLARTTDARIARARNERIAENVRI